MKPNPSSFVEDPNIETCRILTSFRSQMATQVTAKLEFPSSGQFKAADIRNKPTVFPGITNEETSQAIADQMNNAKDLVLRYNNIILTYDNANHTSQTGRCIDLYNTQDVSTDPSYLVEVFQNKEMLLDANTVQKLKDDLGHEHHVIKTLATEYGLPVSKQAVQKAKDYVDGMQATTTATTLTIRVSRKSHLKESQLLSTS
ncbi:uncharacterized protein EV422DRAFT_520557 [Fimicolochytrium jonesii]|uniref:uncharacterized protein n=1 Tax=Fimicolochytrium jonesii TaxID=1396493 RepID=UPI0022FF27FD|nr:uncharacterized protein EV422DRAFT_520557 [Fimicolochytrium jonesii]KAI8824570.1 hypothetical protein EV422DRAFT_520557 [Fimicolochytrium jonesii]